MKFNPKGGGKLEKQSGCRGEWVETRTSVTYKAPVEEGLFRGNILLQCCSVSRKASRTASTDAVKL